MCTSLTYEDYKGDWYLARTMDFGFNLDGRPVVIPRNYHFDSDASANGFDTKFGFTGAGRNLNGYILVDGVNEKGLSAGRPCTLRNQFTLKKRRRNQSILRLTRF